LVINMEKYNCDLEKTIYKNDERKVISCNFSTRYKSNFKRHLYHQHDTVLEEKRNCELCNYHFYGRASALQYERHRKKMHPTEEEIAHKKKLRADRARRYYVNKKLFNSAYQ
jgi:hypothetical protein